MDDDILKPVQIIARILTINPPTNKSKCNNFVYYFRLVFLLILVIGSVICRQIIESIHDSKSIIVASVEFAQYNCRIPITLLCIIMANFNKGVYVKDFFKTAATFDKEFKLMGVGIIDYGVVRKIRRYCLVLLALKLLLQQIPFMLPGFAWEMVDILDYINFNVPLLLIHVVLMQWLIYLNVLSLHFKTLNRIVKNLRYRQCWVAEDFHRLRKLEPNTLPVSEVVRTSGIIYDKLCLQAQKLNAAFAWQLLVLIPALFILIISSSFHVCQMIKNKIDFDWKSVVYDVLYFGAFLELVLPCVVVKERAARFVDVLHRVDVNFGDNYSHIDDVLNCAVLQTFHQRVEFSAHGVFPLDGTLIYSIFGALTTYLVILLQFDF